METRLTLSDTETTRLELLNQALSKHPILQFNNKAGVLGQSTLEPLMITQHLIEHARIKKKPIWIVL
ncbi:unnamed protein product [Rhizophagus irregularis]|nr:unnamed protein product [Rhizophagus irregularis]